MSIWHFPDETMIVHLVPFPFPVSFDKLASTLLSLEKRGDPVPYYTAIPTTSVEMSLLATGGTFPKSCKTPKVYQKSISAKFLKVSKKYAKSVRR